jgi:COP9 signalosome complex subunit 6
MDKEKTPTPGSVIEKEGGSALNISLHPLVIINISDHATRARMQSADGKSQPRVLGALFGVQSGRNVEIFNSFEIVYTDVEGALVIDTEYVKAKQEQFSLVFKNYDLLGWYSTGSECKPKDIEIHQQFIPFNESPLYLLLDPIASKINTRGLPITLYESELRIINDEPTMLFSKVQYKIETGEAERIAVDHVAHVMPTGGEAGSQLTAHLMGTHNAIKMLHTKIKILKRFLEATATGGVKADHGLLRQIAGLCNLLPAIDTDAFKEDFLNEYNDALLVTYLSSITKGASIINDMVDRYNTAYDRQGRRRGFGFF